MRLRIKFKKYGPVRYIGHLDVMRFFQKAIRRAQIDVAYSNGFSPHQIMAFAAPLGVGLTSNGEYMDIEVHSMECASSMGCSSPIVSCADVLARLNAVSVHGIEVVSVKVLPDNAGNAMASVAAADYTVRFRQGREPETDIRAALPAFLAREQILITKESRKGSREVDIRPGIFQLTAEELPMEEFSAEDFRNDAMGEEHPMGELHPIVLRMLLDASSSGNIKPVQVIQALLADHGESLKENALIVTREDVYTDVGTSDKRVLVPLDDIGYVC